MRCRVGNFCAVIDIVMLLCFYAILWGGGVECGEFHNLNPSPSTQNTWSKNYNITVTRFYAIRTSKKTQSPFITGQTESKNIGGKGGFRTLDACYSIPNFEAGTFNRSVTFPYALLYAFEVSLSSGFCVLFARYYKINNIHRIFTNAQICYIVVKNKHYTTKFCGIVLKI